MIILLGGIMCVTYYSLKFLSLSLSFSLSGYVYFVNWNNMQERLFYGFEIAVKQHALSNPVTFTKIALLT